MDLPANVKVYELKPEDIMPDPENANLGTERGDWMLEESLERYGSVRGGALDADNVVIAGNKSSEKAIQHGHRILVVETDGETYVFTKRKDMRLAEGGRAREAAVADNRTGQVNLKFDSVKLQALDVDVSYMWMDHEWKVAVEDFHEPPTSHHDVGRGSERHSGTRSACKNCGGKLRCEDCGEIYG